MYFYFSCVISISIYFILYHMEDLGLLNFGFYQIYLPFMFFSYLSFMLFSSDFKVRVMSSLILFYFMVGIFSAPFFAYFYSTYSSWYFMISIYLLVSFLNAILCVFVYFSLFKYYDLKIGFFYISLVPLCSTLITYLSIVFIYSFFNHKDYVSVLNTLRAVPGFVDGICGMVLLSLFSSYVYEGSKLTKKALRS